MDQPAPRPVAGDRRAPNPANPQRALLIDAVTDLLATTPIARLSVMQIAQHAGVTRPVFYFYFESKYTVVAAALERVWFEFGQARTLVEERDLVEPPAVVTRRLISDALEIWQRHAPLLNAFAQARTTDPQLAAMWEELVGGTARPLARRLSGLHTAGRIRPASDDLPALVEVLLGMTLWALTNQGEADPAARERMIDSLTAVWVAAVWGGG